MEDGQSFTLSSFEAQFESLTYLAEVTPVLPSVDVFDPAKQLDNWQQEILATTGAKLQKSEEIQLATSRGREIKASVQGGQQIFRNRFYFTPQAFYSISVLGAKTSMQTKNAQIDRFLNSFRLSPRQIAPRRTPLFTSKTDGFAVQFPVKPTRTETITTLENGQKATLSVFKAPTEAVNYVIIVTPIDSSVDVSDPKAQLNAYETGLLRSIGTKSPGANVQKRTELQLDGFVGREIKLSLLKGELVTRGRIYFTPKAFYSVGAGGSKANVEKQAAQINRVFDSFRILPQ